MSDLATYLGLYVKGDAAAKVAGIEKGFEQLATRGARHMGQLSRSMGLVGQGLDKMANRYTAIITGAAGAGAVKYVGDLQERLNYLGIQAGQSAEQMDDLKRKVFEVAQAPDIRVDPAALLDAIDTIVEKTGDLGLAKENLRNIGLAMRATKSGGQDVGAWVAQLAEKFNIRTEGGILSAIDHSINAGKAGAFAFKDLAAQGEKLTAAYAAMGRTGPAAAAELDSMIQMIRKGVGSSDQAASAFEALMRTFADAEKIKKLTSKGIQVMDPEDPKRMRAVQDIVKDVIRASGGDMVKLSTIFDAEAIRALTAATSEFKATGGFKSFDDFLGVASDGASLKADAIAANAKNMNAAIGSLVTAGRQFADANLAGPVGELADMIARLEPETVQATFKALAWGAGALGAVIAVKKGVDAVRWTADTVRYVRGGRGGGGGAAASAAGALGGGIGATPVMVTNWPMGGLGGGIDAGAAGGNAKAAAGGKARGLLGRVAARGSKMLPMLGRLGGAATVVTGGVMMASAISQGDTKGAVGAGGGMAGGLAGAAAGAAIGSVVPVIGTIVGGVIGGALGAWGGGAASEKLYELFATKEDKPTKVDGVIDVRVTAADGTTASVSGTSTGDVPVDVGYTVR